LIKNSQPFGKKFQKTAGGGIFLSHTVYGIGDDNSLVEFHQYLVMPKFDKISMI